MIKFKTFFRKAHGASGSGSAAKNKNLTDRAKENHFESAVAAQAVSQPATARNDTAAASVVSIFDNNEFEIKPAVTCGVLVGIPSPPPRIVVSKDDDYCSHESNENSSFSKLSDSSDMGLEYENLKKEFESVLDEKSNLELALQELVKSHGELETVKKEIEELKNQRNDIQNSILLRLSKVDNLATAADSAEKNARNKKLPNSAPASIAPPTESTEMLDAQDWDKHSSSSLSEVSVACLQDRIMQMEETHYSTSEELQATLQELADLQTQLSELQNDNERLGEEKGVLLESLCRQTEKLEDARTKVDTLQDLLLDTNKTENSFSEREQKLMLLLRDGQQDREVLLLKQKEVMNELEELNRNLERQKQESNSLKDRVHLLESTVEAANAERKQFEHELSNAKEENSCKCIEINRLETLLENARSKIEKMEEARDMESDKNDIDDLIDSLRKEKDHLEMKVASLQEQLSKSMCEIVKLKEQLLHAQEECRVARNNAKSAVNDLEYKCQKYKEETERTTNELRELRENYLELEVQCQCQLDDKKQLKSVLLETQQHLAECERTQEELKQSLEDEKKLRIEEQSEWEQFQNDLLMTVRVANDLKTEAQGELQRLVLENKQLRDKIKLLETKIQTLTKVENTSTPLLHRTLSNTETSSYFTLSQEMNRRPKAGKMLRQDSRLSVKSLIESIENAAKQAKTGNVCIRSHSASSLNLTNQLSGSSSPSSDIAVSSLGQLKDSYELHISKKSCEEHISPNNSLILANTKGIEFARKASANDICEKKDPLQALVKNGGSKRNALLKWCQNKVAGYANVDITNFSSSWNDGMALCALLHSYLPDKVPYDTLNPADKKRNFTIAFEAAESVGIKTSLNIIDMIQEERPDWNQVMAYVTTIFRHFES